MCGLDLLQVFLLLLLVLNAADVYLLLCVRGQIYMCYYVYVKSITIIKLIL